MSGATPLLADDRLVERAERLLSGPVALPDLAVGFSESTASSAEILVEGSAFYPPMLADIASASSSVHVNQFGFRPGEIGDRFADVLVAKAQEGVPVRLVVDRQGSDPEGGARGFYERLVGAGVEVVHGKRRDSRVRRGGFAAIIRGVFSRSGKGLHH